MKLLCLAVLLFLPSGALAADWAMRDGDRPLTPAEVDRLTEGQTLEFHDDGQSRFSAGGAYSYTYASGAAAYGRYRVEADGTVCIDYRNGFARCDRYVQSGSRFVMLTEAGDRFPLRSPVPE